MILTAGFFDPNSGGAHLALVGGIDATTPSLYVTLTEEA